MESNSDTPKTLTECSQRVNAAFDTLNANDLAHAVSEYMRLDNES